MAFTTDVMVTIKYAVAAVPVTSLASTAKFMQFTAKKLDRNVAMVNTSQVATRQLIEELRSKFKKDQEEIAERATKKAHLSADAIFRKKGNEKQYRFNDELQEKMQIAGARV